MSLSYTHMDKSEWGAGPWNDEPDKLQWVDEATGFDCLIVRNRMGGLCGYVGVPPGHPLHGHGYEDPDVAVHGGLTYADSCDDDAPEDRGICHIPEPGRPKDVWWFGFDCGHFSDLLPSIAAFDRKCGREPIAALHTYRDLAYVRAECGELARQLR